MEKTINIAKEFSRYPYGRLRAHSGTSGEVFRQDLLLPAIQECEHVMVELDGVEGYGSSFLDESFANLIRVDKLDKALIKQKLSFVSEEDPSLIDEIMQYIEEA